MMDLAQPLKDKVAVVTGGAGGIGLATARMLAQRGASVAIGDIAEGAMQKAVDEIITDGGDAMTVTMDVSSEESVAAGIAQVVARHGRIDIFHANAAQTGFMAQDGWLTEMDAAFWDRAFAINLRGPMLCAKHAIPHMLAAGGGSFVFTGSGKSIAGDLDFPAYGTSKAGLSGLSRYIATQYGKQGIRSNVVVVGLVMTAALDANMSSEAQKLIQEHNLVDYLGSPEDVAEAVAFLASDQSRYITGSSLTVDGGFTAHSAVFADMMRFAAVQGAAVQ